MNNKIVDKLTYSVSNMSIKTCDAYESITHNKNVETLANYMSDVLSTKTFGKTLGRKPNKTYNIFTCSNPECRNIYSGKKFHRENLDFCNLGCLRSVYIKK